MSLFLGNAQDCVLCPCRSGRILLQILKRITFVMVLSITIPLAYKDVGTPLLVSHQATVYRFSPLVRRTVGCISVPMKSAVRFYMYPSEG